MMCCTGDKAAWAGWIGNTWKTQDIISHGEYLIVEDRRESPGLLNAA